MKRNSVLLILIISVCLTVFMLSGCSLFRNGTNQIKDGAVNPDGNISSDRVESVEIYNRTGKIQRKDCYGYSSGSASVDYSVIYSYDDSGRLVEVKKNGGGLGSNTPMETFMYSGDNCTQHVIFDSNGSTKQAVYYSYGKNGNLQKERTVTMIPSVSGYGYSGKTEEVTEYGEDGLAGEYFCSAPDGYSKDEFGYDSSGNLVTDNYYQSADGETYLFLESRTYVYDESGKALKETKTDASGVAYYVRVYEYNDSGNLVSDTAYSSQDLSEKNRIFRFDYEYNQAGLVSFELYVCGNESKQTYYEYDGQGCCTCISENRYSSGSLKGTSVTRTEYDSYCSPVKETLIRDDGTERVNFHSEYEYYDDGEVRKKTDFCV